MDCKIWEKTILAWVNTMISGTPINKINHLNDAVLSDIISKFKFDSQSPTDFLKITFPNLFVSDPFPLSSPHDYLSAATCLLIYVSFSKRIDLQQLKEKMCEMLDNTIQQNLAEFLTNISNHKDVFKLSLKTITKEIFDFTEVHESQNCLIGDSFSTPVKGNTSNISYDSPLQGFFQTPKRNQDGKQSKVPSTLCGDGDHIRHIKQLNDHLLEEELEKNSLQEKLSANLQRCNDLEMKLKDKMKEIHHLKQEWEMETKKNEEEVNLLKDKLQKKYDDEKKIKSEITNMEHFIKSLESDLSESNSERIQLKNQLKLSLDKYSKSEDELKEVKEINLQLNSILSSKEKELAQLQEGIDISCRNEKVCDVNLADGSFDTSLCIPETMDVVIDKLLKEKIEENESLKGVIEEITRGKYDLENQIEKLKTELVEKNSVISEFEFLNKELHIKVEHFEETKKELSEVQKELITANAEINKLFKENSDLNEKYSALDSKALKNEQALMNFKHSKILIHFDFLKLAHDFNSVQQRLESEVNNFVNLTSDKNGISTSENIEENENVYKKENCADSTYNCITTTCQSTTTDDGKLEQLRELLNNFKFYDNDWMESKTSMQNACSKINESIVSLKLKMSDLEDIKKNSLKEKNQLQKCLQTAEQKLAEIECKHSTQMQKLKVELEEKKQKIIELENLLLKLKESQANSLLAKEISKNKSNLKAPYKKEFSQEAGDFAKRVALHHSNGNRDLKKANNVILSNQEKEILEDSLEEVPLCSKTFDIVHLEDKNIIDKTFSISKESVDINTNKNSAFWSVSPPPKVPPKPVVRERRRVRGETWVVPIVPVKAKQGVAKNSYSTNDLTGVESSSNFTKSSSLSSIAEAISSPASKGESKSSGGTSFFSVTDLFSSMHKKGSDKTKSNLRHTYSSEEYLQGLKSENPLSHVFRLVDRQEDPLGEIFLNDNMECDRSKKREWEKKFSQMRKEIIELSNECERLRSSLLESEQKWKKEKETLEKNQSTAIQNVTSKYQIELEQIKMDMKQLYNTELAKHKTEQSKLNSELRNQNKRDKEHIDQLRNQLWDLREKLLQEQKINRDLERSCNDLKKKHEQLILSKDMDMRGSFISESSHHKELNQEKIRNSALRQLHRATFPTIPTEDEDEVFDNRFLDDLKKGMYPTENTEGRLLELQTRNTLCLPHLKSSYPAETQFHNPSMFKESDLKYGLLQFGQESHSLTDSDHSMTRSLLPENKGKKKEQTSYKRPGPPTPSKHGGRLSIQNGDCRVTPRNALKEINDQNERNKGTPNKLKVFLPSKSAKRESIGSRDENSIPVTPRKKLGKIFRKPFGARDH